MISEKKMQIVINNYFNSECSVDTSIRQAFEKGFRIGLKKGLSAQPEPRWIPCSERLPEDGTYVLGYMAYGQCSVLKCDGGRLYTAGCWVPLPKNAVTHWQYLPDVPKEAQE